MDAIFTALQLGASLTISNGIKDIRLFFFSFQLIQNKLVSDFSQKYGIYSVDFNDPARPREQKLSARTYAKIVADNGFPAPAKN